MLVTTHGFSSSHSVREGLKNLLGFLLFIRLRPYEMLLMEDFDVGGIVGKVITMFNEGVEISL